MSEYTTGPHWAESPGFRVGSVQPSAPPSFGSVITGSVMVVTPVFRTTKG